MEAAQSTSTPEGSDPAVVLEGQGLAIGYGDLAVARGINLTVRAGEVVAVLGPNGSGKSTLLRTLVGLLKPLAGEVLFQGRVTHAPLHRRARMGLAYIAEDRSLIPDLTVLDNLRLAKVDVERIVADAPALGPLLRRRAGLLSGGEQQLLGAARALGRDPAVLVVDEISQGLSPLAVEAVWELVARAASTGTAVVVVEQVLGRAIELSDHFLVLRQGGIALADKSVGYRGRLAEIERLHLATAS